jgi:uncharacterized RDD family membrane protein YckC
VVLHPSAAPLRCHGCGAHYRRGDVFCRECGIQVGQPGGPPKLICAGCGAAVVLPARFCSTCGRMLDAAARKPPEPAAVPGTSPRSTGSMAIAPAGQRSWEAARAALPESAPRHDPLFLEERCEDEPAEVGGRIAAALVDAVFVLSGQAVVIAPVFWYWWAREAPRGPADVRFLPVLASVLLALLTVLLGALYHVYFWSVKGATPGKELMDLQVQGEDGRSPIGLGRAVLRVFGYLLDVASLGIGFLMVAFTGSGLHDRIAGTRVVKVKVKRR